MTTFELRDIHYHRRQWHRRAIKAFAGALMPMMLATFLAAYMIVNYLSILLPFSSPLLEWIVSQPPPMAFVALLPFSFLFSIPLVVASAGPYPTRNKLRIR